MKLNLVTSVASLALCLACSAPSEGGSVPNGSSGGTAGSGGAPTGAGSAQGGSAGSQGGNVSQGGAAGSAVIVGGSAGAAGAAAGATGAAGAAGSGGALPTDPGELLYFNNCQLCHGANGVGGPLAPEVQHPVTDHATWVVRNGLPGVGYVKPMEPIAADKLSEADLALIWGFLDKPPQPTTAEGLYKDYCGNCHGADGKGGPTTRDITNELAELRDIVRDGAHPGEFELRNEYMPALPSTVLTDAEVDLIYAYVESL